MKKFLGLALGVAMLCGCGAPMDIESLVPPVMLLAEGSDSRCGYIILIDHIGQTKRITTANIFWRWANNVSASYAPGDTIIFAKQDGASVERGK